MLSAENINQKHSEEELASLLANVIQRELSVAKLPKGKYKKKLIDTLYEKAPPRTELRYQTDRGVDAPKRALSEVISNKPEPSSEELKRLFCLAHGEFMATAGMDIEHADPYADIRENQNRLIDYLNKEKQASFTNIFLKVEGIEQYFRRDKNDKVRGTGYFYQLCYNAIENIYLLCHACNLHKSNADPLEWFLGEDTYFGQPFIEEVKREGGLHEGILFKRIYKQTDETPVLMLSKDNPIYLPADGSCGLGEFVRDWFFANFKETFEHHKNFYNENYVVLKSHLEEVQGYVSRNELIKAHKAHRRLKESMKILAQIQKEVAGATIRSISSGSSHSSGNDDLQGRQNYLDKTAEITTEDVLCGREINKIRKLILRTYRNENLSRNICDLCFDLQKNEHILSENWMTIRETLTEACLSEENGVRIYQEKELAAKVIELYENYSEKATVKKENLSLKQELAKLKEKMSVSDKVSQEKKKNKKRKRCSQKFFKNHFESEPEYFSRYKLSSDSSSDETQKIQQPRKIIKRTDSDFTDPKNRASPKPKI